MASCERQAAVDWFRSSAGAQRMLRDVHVSAPSRDGSFGGNRFGDLRRPRAGGVVVAVDGAVTAQALPVIFGTLWAVGWGYIYWRLFHLASRLEFTGGCLSWRGSMAWSPAMRPGRVKAIRWPASRRSEHVGIELDDGRKVAVRPGLGLMEFIHRVQEADPDIDVDVRPSGQAAIRMNMEPLGFTEQRGLVGGNNRAFRRSFSVVMVLALLVAAVETGLTLTGPQKNFHTLRSDLAHVHLPAGYRLIATRQAGPTAASSARSPRPGPGRPAAPVPAPPPAPTSTTPCRPHGRGWTPTRRCQPTLPAITTPSWVAFSILGRASARSKPSSGLARPG